MSYSTKEEVREMLKDDALNAIIGDTFIEDPAEREELVEPLIEAAIADADAEIDGYLAKRYTVPISPAPRVLNKFSKDIAVYNLFSRIGIDESTDKDLSQPIQRGDQVPHPRRRGEGLDRHRDRRSGERGSYRIFGKVKPPSIHAGEDEGDVVRV